MKTTTSLVWLVILCASAPALSWAEDAGLPALDLKELLKRTLRDGTRVTVSDAAATNTSGGAAANQLRLARAEPVRLKNARPSRIDVVFVVNHQQAQPDSPPVNGIVPVIDEKVTRQLDVKREEWSERTRNNARRAFGEVPLNFENTLYNDLQEHHTDRLEAAGYVEKTQTPITVPDDTAKMRMFVKEHYEARDTREVRVEATVACAPRLMDNPDPDALGVVIAARIAGPLAKTVATGNLAEIDPEHLQQFERRVTKEAEFVVNWFNKEPLRRVSIRQLEEARASGTPVTNPLRYPWFGERGSIHVALTPPPKGALPNRDYSEEWGAPR